MGHEQEPEERTDVEKLEVVTDSVEEPYASLRDPPGSLEVLSVSALLPQTEDLAEEAPSVALKEVSPLKVMLGCAMCRSTGALSFRCQDASVSLFYQGGAIVWVAAGLKSFKLSEFLISGAACSAESYRTAANQAQPNDAEVLRVLIELGQCDVERLSTLAVEWSERVISHLLAWQDGSCAFSEAEAFQPPIDLGFSPFDTLTAAVRKGLSSDFVDERLGEFLARPVIAVAGAAVRVDQLGLNAEEIPVLRQVDGQRTLGALLSPFDFGSAAYASALRAVYICSQAEVVRFGDAVAPRRGASLPPSRGSGSGSAGGEGSARTPPPSVEAMAGQAPPQSVEQYLLQAEVLVKNRSYFEALQKLEQGVAKYPADPRLLMARAYHRYLADTYDRRGTALAMIKELEVLVEQHPNREIGHLYLGRLYKFVKDRDRSSAAFQRVFELDPTNHEAQTEVRVAEGTAGLGSKKVQPGDRAGSALSFFKKALQKTEPAKPAREAPSRDESRALVKPKKDEAQRPKRPKGFGDWNKLEGAKADAKDAKAKGKPKDKK